VVHTVTASGTHSNSQWYTQ